MRQSNGTDVMHACELVILARSSYCHRCCPRDYTSLTLRLHELTGLRGMDIEGLHANAKVM